MRLLRPLLLSASIVPMLLEAVATHGTCLALEIGGGVTGVPLGSKTNFTRAIREGPVTASARPLHTGRTIILIETEIARADGRSPRIQHRRRRFTIRSAD